jgi:hypothetical protein
MGEIERCSHHVSGMLAKIKVQADVVSGDAEALARWNDEGGAIGPLVKIPPALACQRKNKAEGVEVPALPPTDETLDGEDGVLKYLGAAVAMRWGTIPAKLRRELFESANSLAELGRVPDTQLEVPFKQTAGEAACDAYLAQERAVLDDYHKGAARQH